MDVRRSQRTTLVTALVGLASTVAVLAGGVPVAQATTTARVSAIAPDTYEDRVLRLINQERADRGLARLRPHGCTDYYAERWSRYLAQNDLFRHQSLDPFFDRCGARYAGETLARGASTPRAMVTAWLRSDGHRRIMLGRTPRRIGVAATLDAEGRWVLAADYTRF